MNGVDASRLDIPKIFHKQHGRAVPCVLACVFVVQAEIIRARARKTCGGKQAHRDCSGRDDRARGRARAIEACDAG